MSFSDSETVDIPTQPTSMQVMVELGASTHAGRVRPNNEDSYLVARASRSLETVLTNLQAGDFPVWAAERAYGLIVADGMGGHAGGEVASQLALRTVIEHALATADWIMRDACAHSDQIEERIVERFAAANEAVLDQASRDPNLDGMGTTMTMALSSGACLYVGYVGDSRAYLLRGGQLQALTRDHSFAQALADSGVISPEQAATHNLRNVLLRNLGRTASTADIRHLFLESGDQLLLCTDGLTDMVADASISKILKAAPTAQAACDQLIAAALEAGGKDNVTAVLAKYSW
jgi:serine/threonine protein phosphatase PrpC